jgi:hypothetical protein
MSQLDRNKAGASVGLFLGGWHLIWSLLVASGWGQPIIDFVLWMHMVHLQYIVGPFELRAAAVLVLLTTLGGYAIGWLFAFVWNLLHRNAE